MKRKKDKWLSMFNSKLQQETLTSDDNEYNVININNTIVSFESEDEKETIV